MPTRAFSLAMQTPLHVGRAGIGFEETIEYVPSDTLFSALVVTWLQMGEYALVDEIENSFKTTPALQLSSAFPTIGGVRLLPRPRLNFTGQKGTSAPESAEQPERKKFKKVQWVSEKVFQHITNHADGLSLENLWREAKLVQDGSVWVSESERNQIATALDKNADHDLAGWQVARVPHVVVDRNSSASTLYHVGRVHFAEKSGLWFLVRGDVAWLDRVERALLLLADEGIGGQRSRGHGRFDLDSQVDVPTFGATDGNYQILLSRVAPKAEEMDLLRAKNSRYDLVTVGGYSTYPGRESVVRRRVRLLAEGSIIQNSQTPPGQLVDVKPEIVDHPIYRYGYGFGVPITLPEPEHTKAEISA